MKGLIAALLLLSASVQADIYLDMGLSIHNDTDTWINISTYTNRPEPIYNLLGTVELGYTWDNKTVYLYHISGTQQYDTGLNMIGFKFRVF